MKKERTEEESSRKLFSHKFGTVVAFVVENYNGGGDDRRSFKTESDARAYADSILRGDEQILIKRTEVLDFLSLNKEPRM